jgi:transglutaminase-like putative cysteine protease
MTHTFVEDGVSVVDGREVPVSVWKTTTSVMPVTGIEHYTADGDKVYEEISLPGLGKMVTRLATEAEALAGGDGAGPEILIRTFVEPDRPIRDAGRATTATLRLSVDEGAIPPLPSAAAQRVTAGADGGTVTLVIDINDNLPAAAAEVGDPSYLASSAMVNAGDPLIGKLAARAVRGAEADGLARADALRAAVRLYISSKGLDTGFATASETARTRTGDCSEHAVLLCALLRAQEIPARVAIGLVYAEAFLGHEAIFGWHMWTQALIDGRWVDLDATLGSRYHAGHVLTAVSSLDEGGIDAALASSLLLMGNLRIEVVEVGYESDG